MGIFMDSIDFNECLKKKKELEKEAESTAPEEVREEKVEEKKGKKSAKSIPRWTGILHTMIPRATLACTRRGRGFILPYLFWY